MANNPTASANGRNTMLNAFLALLNNGSLELYDGTQPATPDTAISTQARLCVLSFGSTAFGAASSGSATANAIGGGVGLANSTAAWGRARPPAATPATATATVTSNAVASVTVDTAGTGYTTPPAVVFSGGGGSGATAHAVLSGATVGSIVVDSGGSGYTGTPTVGFAGGGAALLDGTVGSTGCDINMNSTAISVGEAIAITAMTVTHP